MNKFFHMDDKLFELWVDLLIDKPYNFHYDWNTHCNQISEPKYGLRLVHWTAKSFEVTDERKYTIFLLRYA